MRRVIIGSVLLLVVGCARETVLRPAPGAVSVEQGAISRTVDGVEVMANAEAWSGIPQRLEAVEPIRLTIENRGNRPLRIRYDQFSLITMDGKTLSALPPYTIDEDTATARVLVEEEGLGGVFRPNFEFQDYYVAAPYADFYPDLRPWTGQFDYDSAWYEDRAGRWPGDLPSIDMLARAVPEGVVEKGGRISGFLYFQDVPADAERVQFRAELVDAQSGESFGIVQMPFAVRRQ